MGKFDGETLAFSCVRFSNGIIGRFEGIGSNGNWHQSDVIWSVEGTKGEITINGTGELRVYSKEHPNGEVIKYNRHHPHGMAIQDFAKYVLRMTGKNTIYVEILSNMAVWSSVMIFA